MIPSDVKEQLHACPFCGQEGFTRLGLRQHFCVRAPALSGEEPRNHKGSRKLTHDEWYRAVHGVTQVSIHPLQALTIGGLQRCFKIGFIIAQQLHRSIQALPEDVVYHCREDEMLVFHRGGQYHATIYTSGPDCAVAVDQWLRENGKEQA